MLVVGSMVGSGIFIVSADIARQVKSPGLLLLVWLVTAFMTVIAASYYGELAAAMPHSGGQYVFLRESFGLLCTHGMNGGKYYDGDDFIVLSIAKDFFKYGIEPRHLTMYRHFAEREATFFEQIVMPMLRQRNPDARKAAADNLANLASLSKKLKQALLRTNLRQYLTGA